MAKSSPQLYAYLKKYQDDPTSRIFAPLAEAYRKAGLVDEAIDIAREGLKHHPHFIGGKVALARAFFDKKLYAEVIDELTAVIRDVPDNLVAQRLLGESCLMLGRVTEALGAYKMLLYFAPGDNEAAQMVQELETQAYDRGTLVLRTDIRKENDAFAVKSVDEAIDQDPGLKKAQWIRRIELLQGCLQKIERYRTLSRSQPPESHRL